MTIHIISCDLLVGQHDTEVWMPNCNIEPMAERHKQARVSERRRCTKPDKQIARAICTCCASSE